MGDDIENLVYVFTVNGIHVAEGVITQSSK